MLLENYTGDSKVLKAIAHILNRKAPLPLDGDGDAEWGTSGQVLTTDGSGNTYWSAGGGGGGSTVTYTQTLASGTKTGEIQIDGVSTNMYAPTPPTVNDGTLTIQQNGTTLGTFTANQSGNTTVNISAPTAAADVTYDNTASGLSATKVQGAIDELNADVNGAINSTAVSVADIDSLTTTGKYYLELSDTGDIFNAGRTYLLEVFRTTFRGGTLGYVQRASIVYSPSGRTWQRSYYAVGGWSAWQELSNAPGSRLKAERVISSGSSSIADLCADVPDGYSSHYTVTSTSLLTDWGTKAGMIYVDVKIARYGSTCTIEVSGADGSGNPVKYLGQKIGSNYLWKLVTTS